MEISAWRFPGVICATSLRSLRFRAFGSLLARAGFVFLALAIRRFSLSQPLQHRRHNQRQTYGRIYESFAEFPAFRRRNELAPGNGLAVGAAGEASPIDRLGADADAVVVSLERNIFAEAAVTQFDERGELP